jgi:hypothetical protein
MAKGLVLINGAFSETGSGAFDIPGTLNVTKTTGNTLVVDTSTLVADATNNRVGVNDASPVSTLTVGTSNTTSTMSTTYSQLHLANTSATGHSQLTFGFNAVMKAGIRCDYLGDMNYVAIGSQAHQFYTDLAQSALAGSLSSSGLLIGGTAGGVASYKLDVRGNARLDGTTAVLAFTGYTVASDAARITQEAWHEVGSGGGEPAFAGSPAWGNYGAGTWQTCAFFKDSMGIVHLKGMVSGGTVGAAYSIFTLPTGYRQPLNAIFVVMSNNAVGRCTISSVGVVCPETGSNAWYSLDGISFRT